MDTAPINTPDGRPFAWGRIIRVHTVGDFAIVEAEQTEPIRNSDRPNQGVGEITFHAYVNSRSTCTRHSSLDAALAYCIAYKHDPAHENTRAHIYFLRGIGA